MSGHKNIVLAGFMGTGKTTIGRLVAGQLGLVFVDTDDEIETQAGCRIAEIFADGGESAFRQIEADVCYRIAGEDDRVIATGGGALLNPDVYAAFAARSLVICLSCDLDEIMRRVGDDPTRPLFSAERDRLARLLNQRSGLYDSLPFQIDTTHRTPQQVTEEIVRLWRQQT